MRPWWLRYVIWLLLQLLKRHTQLHLCIGRTQMTINVGQTNTAHIAPTLAGVPTTVTSVVYTVTPAGAFTIVPAADGLSAVYTAAVVGTGNVATVTAVDINGVTVTDSAALNDVVAPPPAVLNLTITQP